MKKLPLIVIVCALLLLPFNGCSSYTLFDSVSELRQSVYVGESEHYSLQANAGFREQPYVADGVIGDISPYFEVRVICTDHTKTLNISFAIDGKEHGGELSFDNVTERYSYSESIEVTDAAEIVFTIEGESITATAVSSEDYSEAVLSAVASQESALFESLTKNKRLQGEIYIRLLFDEKCYYYVGVTDKSGTTRSFLTDTAGKILAKR